MRCPVCGSRLNQRAFICPECGLALNKSPAENQPDASQTKKPGGRRAAVLVVLGLAVIITAITAAYIVSSSIETTVDHTVGLTGDPVDILIEEADVSGRVLFDKQGLIVRFESFDSDEYFSYMDVSIENNSDSDIILQCEDVSVNGTMVSGTIHAEVPRGEKQNNAVSFSAAELHNADITTIRDVELRLMLVDPETYESFDISDVISLSAADDKPFAETGQAGVTVILAQDEYTIRYMGPARAQGAPEEGLCLVVENGGPCTIAVDVVDAAINGDNLSTFFYCRVLAGKKAYKNLTVYGGFPDQYDSGEQNEITFRIEIIDLDTYETILVSEKLTVRV